ncbi:MAG: outer membrane protein assembly factor BamA [Salinivirgaceae bacterium]|nr:outer membrane protein assembly factor BamA [Salinivirgaceae bacterium]
MMRNKFFAIAIFSITSLTLFSQSTTNSKLDKIDYLKPKDYEIGGVTISGIKYLDKNVLVHLSGLKVGETITVPGDDITKAINNLWKHGLFGDVEISATKVIGDKIFLDIYLKERPRLSKFSFTGVKKAEAEDLRDEIKLIRGSQVTDDILNLTENRVRKFYVAKGFYNTEVNIVQQDDSLMPNTVILTINVDKNQRIKINEIYFEGNTVFSVAKLRRSMKDTKRKIWYNIFKSSKYIESVFNEDKKKVIAKYNEQGYRDANIEIDSVYVYDEKTVNIYLKINEGKQYFFRDISWVGNTKYPSELLDRELGINKGDVFDQSVLDKRLFGEENAVSALYLDRGYLFFSAVPVEVNIDNDSIDLEIRIYEGKQARINKIIITGNTRTNEHVIRREIWTKPGELFSRSDIIRTNRELATLGYFDPEKLDVKPVPNQAEGTVDIEYIVEERASDQIELSGGWGGNMFIGTLGLTFSNFSLRNIANLESYHPLPTGDGQKLSIRAQTNGTYYQSYSMSFTEPWLGGKKPNSLSFSMYHSLQSSGNWYNRADDEKGNNMKITGVSLGLGRRLAWPDSYFTLYHEASYQRYKLNNYTRSYFQFTNGTANNFNFTTVFGRNSVDQPLYPRRGANMSLSLSVTPPYSLFKKNDFWKLGDSEIAEIESIYDDPSREINQRETANRIKFIEYHKWKFKSDWYTQIVDKLVLRTNIEFGYLGTYSKNLGYSPFETFQLGGDGMSGMGGGSYYYGTDIVPLRGYSSGNGTGSITASPQGNIYDKFVMELRYPLTLNPSATIYALAFLEAGNSWYEMKDFNPFGVYRAAGVGLRFWLPMFGMLGIDWGYGFDDVPGKPKANKGQFGFTIGQQF